MISCAFYFCIILHKEVSLCDTPIVELLIFSVGSRIIFHTHSTGVFPFEQGTILANGKDLRAFSARVLDDH